MHKNNVILWFKKLFKIKSKPDLSATELDQCRAYSAMPTNPDDSIVLRLVFKVPASADIITRDVTIHGTTPRSIALKPYGVQWLVNDRARLILNATEYAYLLGVYKTVDFDLVDTVKDTEGLYHDNEFCVDRLSDLDFVGFSVVSEPAFRLRIHQF